MDPITEISRRQRAAAMRQEHQSHLDRLRQLFPSDEAADEAEDVLQRAANRPRQAVSVEEARDAGAADARQPGQGDVEHTLSVDEQQQVRGMAERHVASTGSFRERLGRAVRAYQRARSSADADG